MMLFATATKTIFIRNSPTVDGMVVIYNEIFAEGDIFHLLRNPHTDGNLNAL